MPTFLTTSRMSPELRARIEESLRTDAVARVGGANRRRGKFAFRLLVLASVTALGSFLLSTYRDAQRDFEQAKQVLSNRFSKQAEPYDDDFRARLRKVRTALLSPEDLFAGDEVSPAQLVSDRTRFRRMVDFPLVYVRGPERAFVDQKRAWGQVAESRPDALIRCLIEPPSNIKESVLLRHLGTVYQPSFSAGRFIDLAPAKDAVDFLDSNYATRLRQASSMRSLQLLDAELREADLPSGRDLREARTLFFVVDEEKTKGTVSDFDGEAEHFLKIVWMDLDSDEVYLRVRRLVDPQWISEKSRLAYSRELDSCRLAFELVHEESKEGPENPDPSPLVGHGRESTRADSTRSAL